MSDEKYVLCGPRDDKPLPDLPLGHFLLQKLKQHGDKVAQVYPDSNETYTFADIHARAVSVAEELEAHGVKLGDVIVVILTVSSDYAPLLVGTLLLGATLAPLNPAFDKGDLKALLTIYQPKLIFCGANSAAAVEEIIPHLDSRPKLIQFQSGTWDNFLHRRSNPDYRPADIPDFLNREALIMCSSGTTGLPKGVMLSHGSCLAQMITSLDPCLQFSLIDDTVLQLPPVFWISGFLMQTLSLACGSKLVVLPTFTGEKVLKTVHDYKITMMFVSPALAALLASTPLVGQYNLSSVRNVMCSGGSMSSEMQDKLQTVLKTRLNQWFAMTETLLVIGNNPGDEIKLGSSGKLQRNVKIKVLDIETDKPVGALQRGELCVIGPGVTKGYFRNPQATADTIDEHGWLHTGDVVYYDEDGYFYVVDRVKDLIKYKGNHVAPIEIEAFLLEHPGVKEVAVVGVRHELDQERPMAVVVRQPGATVTERELVDLVAKNMAEHKWLRGGVLFVDSIPKTTTGKIRRRVLRDQLNQ
ncbi:luciferin 4-monooxygenase [Anabrus simplex]|uniref:luciferin 4-monooxygenase n=1 Tax=Anabrus simplex TaxID=316456 RepID=UPI0035A2A0AE